MTDPLTIFENLRDYYVRYYETPFAVRDEAVERERRELLLDPGAIAQEPWLEPVPRYREVAHPLEESCRRAGAGSELADFAQQGLFPPGRRLRTHQEEALEAAHRDRKHVVLTAGTGSGKTEAFLLPLLARLLSESASWGRNDAGGARAWWEADDTPYEGQREGETGRLPAVRALVLYPMNALVEDQLMRMRRALDSPAARTWLGRERPGHRFFFGRYTGRTPVPGLRDARRLRRLRGDLRKAARRAAEVAGDDRRRYFLPQLDGAEMRSRWDMQDHAPDILITNYTMLNVMLLRRLEEPMLEQTRAWLEEREDHVFTVVVDELHMYRGTPGTEIAFLLRNLLLRLGIADAPEKVRFLAASASVGGEPSRFLDFLEGFFAAPSESFTVLRGDIDRPAGGDAEALAAAAPGLAAAGRAYGQGEGGAAEEGLAEACHAAGTPAEGDARQLAAGLAERAGADAAIHDVCWDEEQGSVRARSAGELASGLFGAQRGDRADALKGLLWALELSHAVRAGARPPARALLLPQRAGRVGVQRPRVPARGEG